MRDGYSNFGFFQALSPDSYETETNGTTIDLKGYNTCVFVVNVDGVDVSQATSNIALVMEHASDSAAGIGAYAVVSSEDVIGSGISRGAALTSGELYIFSVSGTSVADIQSTVLQFGYKGIKRYVRLVVRSNGTADAGSIIMGAVAMLGLPADWPINAT